MKKILSFILLVLVISKGQSQTISPAESTEFCPNADITFTVTVPGSSPFVIPFTNSPTLIQGVYNVTTSGSNTTFNFRGRF